MALGINRQGQKELLGLWGQATEGAKAWLSLLTLLLWIGSVNGLFKALPTLHASNEDSVDTAMLKRSQQAQPSLCASVA